MLSLSYKFYLYVRIFCMSSVLEVKYNQSINQYITVNFTIILFFIFIQITKEQEEGIEHRKRR